MTTEHRCKMCRYWYGADPDASPSTAAAVERSCRGTTGAGDRALARPRVLSAPYNAAGVHA